MTYYRPTKDEFFDGFAFETRAGENWVESFYNTSWGQDDPSDYRVKYLELADLIELGFTIKSQTENKTILFKNVISDRPTYYVIEFHVEFDLPYITLMDMYNHTLIHELHIKNKSELKWLLNRYGILNN